MKEVSEEEAKRIREAIARLPEEIQKMTWDALHDGGSPIWDGDEIVGMAFPMEKEVVT